MQPSTQRLLSTVAIALAGAAVWLVGADTRPAEPPAALSCGPLIRVVPAPR